MSWGRAQPWGELPLVLAQGWAVGFVSPCAVLRPPRRFSRLLRRTRAAVTLQKSLRMVLAQRSYLRTRQAVITIQAFARGMFARRLYRRVRAWQGSGLLSPRQGTVLLALPPPHLSLHRWCGTGKPW